MTTYRPYDADYSVIVVPSISLMHYDSHQSVLYSLSTLSPQIPDPTEDNKTAPLEKMSKGRKHQWKLYTFKIVNGTHLKYFKSGVRSIHHHITFTFAQD